MTAQTPDIAHNSSSDCASDASFSSASLSSGSSLLGLRNLERATSDASLAAVRYPHIHGFKLKGRDGAEYGLPVEQRGRVLIVGGAFVDVTLGLEHMPVVGGDSYARELNVGLGGCALNVAHILRQQGIALDLKVPLGLGPYASIVDIADAS